MARNIAVTICRLAACYQGQSGTVGSALCRVGGNVLIGARIQRRDMATDLAHITQAEHVCTELLLQFEIELLEHVFFRDERRNALERLASIERSVGCICDIQDRRRKTQNQERSAQAAIATSQIRVGRLIRAVVRAYLTEDCTTTESRLRTGTRARVTGTGEGASAIHCDRATAKLPWSAVVCCASDRIGTVGAATTGNVAADVYVVVRFVFNRARTGGIVKRWIIEVVRRLIVHREEGEAEASAKNHVVLQGRRKSEPGRDVRVRRRNFNRWALIGTRDGR